MTDMTETPVERATAMRDRIARLEQHAQDAEQALRDADYLLLAVWKEGRADKHLEAIAAVQTRIAHLVGAWR